MASRIAGGLLGLLVGLVVGFVVLTQGPETYVVCGGGTRLERMGQDAKNLIDRVTSTVRQPPTATPRGPSLGHRRRGHSDCL
jgi:hypothetical protein